MNTLGPEQNGQHFADDFFKCIFFTQNFVILIEISCKLVSKGLNNIELTLIQLMVCC